MVLMPVTEKMIFNAMIFSALKLQSNNWIKLGVVVCTFFLIRVSLFTLLPKRSQELSPFPVATDSANPVSPSAVIHSSGSASPSAQASASAQLYQVTKVIDGDTFKVEIDGKVETYARNCRSTSSG